MVVAEHGRRQMQKEFLLGSQGRDALLGVETGVFCFSVEMVWLFV